MSFRAEASGRFDLFDLHRHDPLAYPFLLQSVAGHPQSGRYDILFAAPSDTLVAQRGRDFFADLSKQIASEKRELATNSPFCGGWFLLLGYEAARFVEPALELPNSPYQLPDALAVRCKAAVIYDREREVSLFIAEDSAEQLNRLRSDYRNCFKYAQQSIDNKTIKSMAEEQEQRFILGVKRIQHYLKSGDTFQVNLSRKWQADLADGADYQSIYSALRQRNPAPFAGLAHWRGSTVLSSSPERLIRLENGWAETRPIAGTRPRSDHESEDRNLLKGLTGNLKERAEHVMLIDLERNDLGRVCEPGSIEVSELMTTESYAHVHHIVSNIRGKLRPNIGPAEAIRAVYPGGTISGCPKVRAMQIIAELEGEGRGPYTGAMGYISRCGRMDTNILIRTLVCENGQVSFRAGAGIVADSQPDAELAETRVKARGLLLALGASA
jgi:anthranilate synthase component 1